MGFTNPFLVLIHLISVLFAGYCHTGDQPISPACNLKIIKAVEDYEYIKEGDIIIGGVITVNALVSRHIRAGYYDKIMMCFE
ncbi:hypothetical protein XELAEV_18003451mg [Xenopus laevis]|nr:hypothetical protein XELAEV_18003451mg [Xenopus laevis]